MGLDSYKSDSQDQETEDTDDDEKQEATTEPESSGLESWNTDASRGGSDTNSDSDDKDEQIYGLPTEKRNQMDHKEWVKLVRAEYIPDFKPDEQLDDRWAYERAVAIKCVCDNRFTFLSSGVCLKCGRRYEDAGRTVVKTYDPEEDGDTVNVRPENN